MSDELYMVPHYENGIIKGLTEKETKEFEFLEKEEEKITPPKPKHIKELVLWSETEEGKKYQQIRRRILELEEKMDGIPNEEYQKQRDGVL